MNDSHKFLRKPNYPRYLWFVCQPFLRSLSSFSLSQALQVPQPLPRPLLQAWWEAIFDQPQSNMLAYQALDIWSQAQLLLQTVKYEEQWTTFRRLGQPANWSSRYQFLFFIAIQLFFCWFREFCGYIGAMLGLLRTRSYGSSHIPHQNSVTILTDLHVWSKGVPTKVGNWLWSCRL